MQGADEQKQVKGGESVANQLAFARPNDNFSPWG
jgi:hypothetical protein